MTPQEKLRAELERIIVRLETMAVPDRDEDDLIHAATEKLRDARDMAGER
jgi:hypothetical protein